MANNLYITQAPATASLSENPILYFVSQSAPANLLTSQSAQFNLNLLVWTGDITGSASAQSYFLATFPSTTQDTFFDVSPIIDSFMTQSLVGSVGMLSSGTTNQGIWFKGELSGSYIDTSSNSRVYLSGVEDQTRWAQQGYIVNTEYLTDRPYEWSWSSTNVRFPFLFTQPAANDVTDVDDPNYKFQRDNWKWNDWFPVTWYSNSTGETVFVPSIDSNISIEYPKDARFVMEMSSGFTASYQNIVTGSTSTNQWYTGWVSAGPNSIVGQYSSSYASSDYVIIYMAESGSFTPLSNKIKINNVCPQREENPIRLYYKNSVGVLDWFDFGGYSRTSIDVGRSTYNKSRLSFNSNKTIDRYQGDTNVYNANGYNSIQLNTGWLREWDKARIEEMLLSEQIFLYPFNYTSINTPIGNIPSYENQALIPLTIKDTNVTFKTDREDKVQQNYALTFQYDQKYKTSF